MTQQGKLLITGGSGMVGRNLLEHPKAQEWDILAPSSSELNLLDIGSVRDYIALNKPDVIVHAAGCVGGIQANMADQAGFLYQNMMMGCQLVRVAKEAGISRLINLASSCMYPKNAENPLVEESILSGYLEPTNEGYALAKIAVMKLCLYITEQNPDLQYKTLVPCNLYGRFDHFDPVRSHMVPSILVKLHNAIRAASNQVEIWGDGHARREFMVTADCADAIFFALDHFDQCSPVMNVGLGRDYSVNEYYQVAAEVVGYSGEFTHDLDRPVGMQQKLVSNHKLKQLGWQSSISLKQGLEQAYQYYMKDYLQEATDG